MPGPPGGGVRFVLSPFRAFAVEETAFADAPIDPVFVRSGEKEREFVAGGVSRILSRLRSEAFAPGLGLG
jgi:hypothetical protein